MDPSARGLISRILFLCGHSSRRSVAARAHQRPTRRFRRLPEPPCRIGPMRSRRLAPRLRLPSLFGLAPCGVYPASPITGGAVRSYRTFSPLPQVAPRRFVFCGTCRLRALTPASRTLSGTLPCGVRTFLPRSRQLARRTPAATARSSCQLLDYPETGFTSSGRGFGTGRPSMPSRHSP